MLMMISSKTLILTVQDKLFFPTMQITLKYCQIKYSLYTPEKFYFVEVSYVIYLFILP